MGKNNFFKHISNLNNKAGKAVSADIDRLLSGKTFDFSGKTEEFFADNLTSNPVKDGGVESLLAYPVEIYYKTKSTCTKSMEGFDKAGVLGQLGRVAIAVCFTAISLVYNIFAQTIIGLHDAAIEIYNAANQEIVR